MVVSHPVESGDITIFEDSGVLDCGGSCKVAQAEAGQAPAGQSSRIGRIPGLKVNPGFDGSFLGPFGQNANCHPNPSPGAQKPAFTFYDRS